MTSTLYDGFLMTFSFVNGLETVMSFPFEKPMGRIEALNEMAKFMNAVDFDSMNVKFTNHHQSIKFDMDKIVNVRSELY